MPMVMPMAILVHLLKIRSVLDVSQRQTGVESAVRKEAEGDLSPGCWATAGSTNDWWKSDVTFDDTKHFTANA